jgi:hypothetical protein
VAVKLSGAPSYSSDVYPYRNVHQYIKRIVDAFGPQRSFWGTDVTRMPCNYHQCVTMYTEEMPWLKGDDLIVKDLGSTNGTFLNEVQLGADKEGTLKPGQILRLGQVELRYETGKKQSEQPRQTVRIGEGSTMVMTKEAGFGKKNNKVNKIFIGVGILLGVVTLGLLAMAFLKLSGSSN